MEFGNAGVGAWSNSIYLLVFVAIKTKNGRNRPGDVLV
jgi:hypothetical protein